MQVTAELAYEAKWFAVAEVVVLKSIWLPPRDRRCDEVVDLLPLLLTATRTVHQLMEDWFSSYPPGMPWTIVSDYSVGDPNKKNDVFSFVVIANHDTAQNISAYISSVAPKDIKNVRRIPQGLIDYLTCQHPITFSVSFVIDQRSSLLRSYLTVDGMTSFIPDACDLIRSLQKHSSESALLDTAYFDDVVDRLDMFEQDLVRKQPNGRLARQIHLVSAFAAVMFHLVTKATHAGHLRWISDRDKLIEQHGTVAYDLAYLYFILLSSDSPRLVREVDGRRVLTLPTTLFELPERTGPNRFDALIRLADYLAGTLADIGADSSYSKAKFGQLLHGALVNSPNNCVVEMLSQGNKITARRRSYV